MMVDSHAHVDMPAFDTDRDEVLARACQGGVTAVVNMGIDRASSRASLELAHRYPRVFTAVGVHPNDSDGAGDDGLDWIGELASDEKAVAVGEIGLDFYRKHSPRERQLDFFRRQLDLAAELAMPVVIHSRQAHKEVLGILEGWVKSLPGGRELGVLHCFSGDVSLAQRYIELGFLVSLAGPVTYPKAVDNVAVARAVPLDKLLVETDAPFLTPQLHRGRRNEPLYVSLVVERIAAIRQVPTDVVARETAQNAIRLFRLPDS